MASNADFNFVDFCHDSANHASMLALAAPEIVQYIVDQCSGARPRDVQSVA